MVPVYVTVKLTVVVSAGTGSLWAGLKENKWLQLVFISKVKSVELGTSRSMLTKMALPTDFLTNYRILM